MKESGNRVFSYRLSNKLSSAWAERSTIDFHVESIRPAQNRVEAEVGVAFFVAAFSGLRHTPVTAATLILGA